MRQTGSAGVELTRHFLASIFEGEWSPSRGQWKAVAVGLIAAALPAGMLMVRELSPDPEYAGKYRILSRLPSPDAFRATALADQLALLIVLASVTALAALLVWQSLFPGRRDYLAFAGLPVGPRQIFGARLASVAIFASALTLAINVLPTLVAPFEYAGRWQKNPSVWVNFYAQGVASGLECLFVFFFIVALQGILLNALPAQLFVRVSVYVQGSLFAVCALGILRSWSIKEWDQAMVARLPSFAWAPPVWFAGLHEYLLGDRDPFLTAMAGRAVTGLGGAIGIAVLTYWLSYRRYRRLLLEAPDRVAVPRYRWNPLALLSTNPHQRGLLQFVSAAMARSRTHRLIWLAYVGFALAIVANSSVIDSVFLSRHNRPMLGALQFMVLFWPLACAVILLPGLKHVMRIPAELQGNWTFKCFESQCRVPWANAVERFVLAYALGPLYAFILPAAVYALGWEIALRMVTLQVLFSLIIFETQFYSWQQLPFTCTYVPGRRPIISIVTGYCAVLGFLVPVASLLIASASRYLPLFVVFGVGFFGGWLKLRGMRREGWRETRILYEDSVTLVADLGIREIRPQTPSSSPLSPPLPPHPAPSSGPPR